MTFAEEKELEASLIKLAHKTQKKMKYILEAVAVAGEKGVCGVRR